jgi:septum formation protein
VKASPPLVLASASPRRRSLLEEHGYSFLVAPADVPEVAPAHLSPGETVLRNARAKCRAVAALYPESIVLGVDTEVALETEVFGKPADMEAAFAMVSRLNGRSHHVYSGLWLARASTGEEIGAVEITTVHFRELSDAALRTYLARIGPLDKAGAYAAQDDRGELIARVEGSYSNVIGLPMERLAQELRRFRS